MEPRGVHQFKLVGGNLAAAGGAVALLSVGLRTTKATATPCCVGVVRLGDAPICEPSERPPTS
jgi:hypothetical protein